MSEKPSFAFPGPHFGNSTYGQEGLTKRELFAAMAMQGMLANPRYFEEMHKIDIHREAVGFADAILAELEKGEK